MEKICGVRMRSEAYGCSFLQQIDTLCFTTKNDPAKMHFVLVKLIFTICYCISETVSVRGV